MNTNEKSRAQSQIALSIIVPMYNSADKLTPCLESLRGLSIEGGHEVIFIDDCSSDGTDVTLERACQTVPHWKFEQTDANSGSPSAPRNLGLDRAIGKYVFFLDGDDEARQEGLALAVSAAELHGLDVVRGPVELVHVGSRRFITDRVPRDRLLKGTVADRISVLAEFQSMTCSALFRRSHLEQIGARFNPAIRMGEDLIFVSEVIVQANDVGYVDSPLFSYLRYPGGAGSAMHSFGSREVEELAVAWSEVEENFALIGQSYLEAHGLATIGYAVRQLIKYQREPISRKSFTALSVFVQKHHTRIFKLGFDSRVLEVLEAANLGSFERFSQTIKPRLLIAGHDLKFIRGAEAELANDYQIRYDEWPSERVHDADKSASELAWADVVWAEWLTQCAVWYSENVTDDQKLIVRMHRYELGREYGEQINDSAVSAYIAIAPHCYEDMIDRFGYDRSRVHYIPNFYRTSDYQQGMDESRMYHLGMIGVAPRRKGLLKGLQALAELRKVDPRYTLTILGKNPGEYPWIAFDPDEGAYYDACARYIDDNGLGSAVVFSGWVDTRTAVAELGFVLSMSDHEGSHVGPGEAFCAGNQGVFLPWRGVDYIYPSKYVFSSVQSMVHYILDNRPLTVFEENVKLGRDHMRAQYDVSKFARRIQNLIGQL